MNESQTDHLRARILDCAIAMFTDKGIEKVTTRELTQQLGISRSHIYHYFRDWGSLRLEAITRFMQNDLDNFKEDVAGFEPDAILNALISNHLPDTHDAVWQLYTSIWTLAVHDDVCADIVISIMNSWTAFIELNVAEGINQGLFRNTDVTRATRIIVAAVNGYGDILSVKPSPDRCLEAKNDLSYMIQNLLAPAHKG